MSPTWVCHTWTPTLPAITRPYSSLLTPWRRSVTTPPCHPCGYPHSPLSPWCMVVVASCLPCPVCPHCCRCHPTPPSHPGLCTIMASPHSLTPHPSHTCLPPHPATHSPRSLPLSKWRCPSPPLQNKLSTSPSHRHPQPPTPVATAAYPTLCARRMVRCTMNAMCASRPLGSSATWKCTWGPTLVSVHSHVWRVARGSPSWPISRSTTWSTLGRNHMPVLSAANDSVPPPTSRRTWGFTLGKSHSHARSALPSSHSSCISSCIAACTLMNAPMNALDANANISVQVASRPTGKPATVCPLIHH